MSVAILAVLSDSSGHRSLNHTEGLTPGEAFYLHNWRLLKELCTIMQPKGS